MFGAATVYLEADRLYRCSGGFGCGKVSPAEQWLYGVGPCETCGEHPGVNCPDPTCREFYDAVYEGGLPELVDLPGREGEPLREKER